MVILRLLLKSSLILLLSTWMVAEVFAQTPSDDTWNSFLTITDRALSTPRALTGMELRALRSDDMIITLLAAERSNRLPKSEIRQRAQALLNVYHLSPMHEWVPRQQEVILTLSSWEFFGVQSAAGLTQSAFARVTQLIPRFFTGATLFDDAQYRFIRFLSGLRSHDIEGYALATDRIPDLPESRLTWQRHRCQIAEHVRNIFVRVGSRLRSRSWYYHTLRKSRHVPLRLATVSLLIDLSLDSRRDVAKTAQKELTRAITILETGVQRETNLFTAAARMATTPGASQSAEVVELLTEMLQEVQRLNAARRTGNALTRARRRALSHQFADLFLNQRLFDELLVEGVPNELFDHVFRLAQLLSSDLSFPGFREVGVRLGHAVTALRQPDVEGDFDYHYTAIYRGFAHPSLWLFMPSPSADDALGEVSISRNSDVRRALEIIDDARVLALTVSSPSQDLASLIRGIAHAAVSTDIHERIAGQRALRAFIDGENHALAHVLGNVIDHIVVGERIQALLYLWLAIDVVESRKGTLLAESQLTPEHLSMAREHFVDAFLSPHDNLLVEIVSTWPEAFGAFAIERVASTYSRFPRRAWSTHCRKTLVRLISNADYTAGDERGARITPLAAHLMLESTPSHHRWQYQIALRGLIWLSLQTRFPSDQAAAISALIYLSHVGTDSPDRKILSAGARGDFGKRARFCALYVYHLFATHYKRWLPFHIQGFENLIATDDQWVGLLVLGRHTLMEYYDGDSNFMRRMANLTRVDPVVGSALREMLISMANDGDSESLRLQASEDLLAVSRLSPLVSDDPLRRLEVDDGAIHRFEAAKISPERWILRVDMQGEEGGDVIRALGNYYGNLVRALLQFHAAGVDSLDPTYEKLRIHFDIIHEVIAVSLTYGQWLDAFVAGTGLRGSPDAIQIALRATLHKADILHREEARRLVVRSLARYIGHTSELKPYSKSKAFAELVRRVPLADLGLDTVEVNTPAYITATMEDAVENLQRDSNMLTGKLLRVPSGHPFEVMRARLGGLPILTLR